MSDCHQNCKERGEAFRIGKSGRSVCLCNCLLYNATEEIINEWDYEKNNQLDIYPRYVTKNSSQIVWWKCKFGHNYDLVINHKNRKTKGKSGCPHCYNKRVDNSNSLATLYPDIAKELAPENGIDPDKIVSGSMLYLKWICKFNPYHIWCTTPYSRTVKFTGCPYCSGYKCEPFQSIVFTHAYLMDEWSRDNILCPYDVSYGSDKKAIWECEEYHHKWEASISSRAINGSGCPYCSGIKVDYYHSIAYTHSDIAIEWHPNNKLSSSQVSHGNDSKRFKWIHHCGYVWESTVYKRIHRSNGCKKCFPKRRSILEDKICDFINKWKIPFESEFKIIALPSRRYDFCILYNNKYFLIEGDGVQHFSYQQYFHRTIDKFIEKQNIDRLKTFTAIQNNYYVIRLHHACLTENSLEQHLEYALINAYPLYVSHPSAYQYILS